MWIMLGVFASLYTAACAVFGLSHPSTCTLSWVMLVITLFCAFYYSSNDKDGSLLTAGDWMLAFGGSVFSLAIFSGSHNPWLMIPTGMILVGISVTWAQNYGKDRGFCYGPDAYFASLLCQFLVPCSIWLAVIAGWWNLLMIALILAGWVTVVWYKSNKEDESPPLGLSDD